MRQILFLLLLLPFFTFDLAAQKPPETADEYEKAYQRRIRQELIRGVYIPKDIGDAFAQLNRLTDKESRAKFKSIPENIAVRKLHFSLGRWLIVNWGFYEGSRLTVWLNQVGLFHPDDMARFVITTYHRNLNRKSLDVKELVEQLLDARAKMEEEQKKKSSKTILSEETRKRQ